MYRLLRTTMTGGAIVGLLTAMLWAGAAPAAAELWTNQADVAVAGWGDNPAHVANPTWATILVNRDFTSTSGLGRTIFVDLEMSSTHCDTVANDLVTLARGTVDSSVGVPSDLRLTATSAHYQGKVSLREIQIVSHDCAHPGAPVITTRDLGSVQITADWAIGKRIGVKNCTFYAPPPPPIVALAFGWRSDDVHASITVSGALGLTLGPASQYAGSVLSTNTLGGIPAPVRPPGCVTG